MVLDWVVLEIMKRVQTGLLYILWNNVHLSGISSSVLVVLDCSVMVVFEIMKRVLGVYFVE